MKPYATTHPVLSSYTRDTASKSDFNPAPISFSLTLAYATNNIAAMKNYGRTRAMPGQVNCHHPGGAYPVRSSRFGLFVGRRV